MPVSDFECQIARGQIGRYLNGGVLSPEAMNGLEGHLADCPTCKGLVAERRAALMGQLEGAIPTHAVVSMPASRSTSKKAEPEASKPRGANAPRYAKPEKTEKTEKVEAETPVRASKPSFGKPLILTALLAVVLIAMSYLTRGNGGKGALGAKADTAFAAQRFADSNATGKTPRTADAAPNSPEAKIPVAPASSREISVAPTTPQPYVAPARTVKPTVAKAAESDTETPSPPAPKAPVKKVPTPTTPLAKNPGAKVPAINPNVVAPKTTATVKPVAAPKVRRTPIRRTAVRRSVTPKSASGVHVYGIEVGAVKP